MESDNMAMLAVRNLKKAYEALIYHKLFSFTYTFFIFSIKLNPKNLYYPLH